MEPQKKKEKKKIKLKKIMLKKYPFILYVLKPKKHTICQKFGSILGGANSHRPGEI